MVCKNNIRIFIQGLLVAAILFNAFAPTANADAATLPENKNDIQTPNDDLKTSITIGNSPTSFSSLVPILSEEIEKQTQAQGATEQPLQIKLEAEPAIYTPGKPIIIKWSLVGGNANQRANLSIVAYPPDGVMPVNKNNVLEADGSLIFSPNADNGTIVWKILDYADLPLTFTFNLVVNEKIVNYSSVLIGTELSATTPGKSSKIRSRDGKVEIDVPANSPSMLMDIRAPGPNELDGSSLSWNPIEILAVDGKSQKNNQIQQPRYHSNQIR